MVTSQIEIFRGEGEIPHDFVAQYARAMVPPPKSIMELKATSAHIRIHSQFVS